MVQEIIKGGLKAVRKRRVKASERDYPDLNLGDRHPKLTKRFLEDHGYEPYMGGDKGMTYDVTDDGIVAYTPYGDEISGRKNQQKTWKNPTLKQLRDWMGYGVAGATVLGAEDAEAGKFNVMHKMTGKKAGGIYSKEEIKDSLYLMEGSSFSPRITANDLDITLGFTEKSLARELNDFLDQMDADAITPETIAENYRHWSKGEIRDKYGNILSGTLKHHQKVGFMHGSTLLQSLKSFPKEQRKAILKKAKELYKNSPKKLAILAALVAVMDEEDAEAIPLPGAYERGKQLEAAQEVNEQIKFETQAPVTLDRDYEREFVASRKEWARGMQKQIKERKAQGLPPVEPVPPEGLTPEIPQTIFGDVKEVTLGGTLDAVTEFGEFVTWAGGKVREMNVPIADMSVQQLMEVWKPFGINLGGRVEFMVPQVEKRGGPVVQTLRTMTQFITGFKGAKALKFKTARPKLTINVEKGKWKPTMTAGMERGVLPMADYAAGGVGSFFAMAPTEDRLSNLIKELPEPFQNPVTDYLENKDDDTRFEGRLKNAVEDTAMTMLMGPIFFLSKYIKTNDWTKAQKAKTAKKQQVADKRAELTNLLKQQKKLSSIGRGNREKALSGKPFKVVRRHGGEFKSQEVKPQGTYFSILDETEKSPFDPEVTGVFKDDFGAQTVIAVEPKKPLVFSEGLKIDARNLRAGAMSQQPVGAGVQALKALVSPVEFQRLIKLSKQQLEAEVSQQFPQLSGLKRYDGLELLEVLGAQTAKRKGYDSIIAIDNEAPNFSEFVSLGDGPWLHGERPGAVREKIRSTTNDINVLEGTVSDAPAVESLGSGVLKRIKKRASDHPDHQVLEGQRVVIRGAAKGSVVDIPPFSFNFGNAHTDIGIQEMHAGLRKELAKIIAQIDPRQHKDIIADVVAKMEGRNFDDVLKELPDPTQGINDVDYLAARLMNAMSAKRIFELKNMVLEGAEGAENKLMEAVAAHTKFEVMQQRYSATAGRLLRSAGIGLEDPGLAKIAGEGVPVSDMSVFGKFGMHIDEVLEMLPEDAKTLAHRLDEFDSDEQLEVFARQLSKMDKKPKTAQVFLEYWINALLSGPSTHVVNILGNMSTSLMYIPEKFIAASFSKIRGTPDGIKYRDVVNAGFGFMGGVKDGVLLLGRNMRTMAGQRAPWQNRFDASELEIATGTKLEAVGGKKAIAAETFGLNPQGPLGRIVSYMGIWMRTPGDLLMTMDGMFKSIPKRAEMRLQASRQADLNNIPDEKRAAYIEKLMREEPRSLVKMADDEARYRTFTTELGPAGRHLEAVMEEFPWMRVIMPFIRTPTNIVKFAAEHSPLGLLGKSSFAEGLAPINAAIKKGGVEGDLVLAKVAMGSGIMSVTAAYAASGQITGGGPRDPELRKAWLRVHQPYSFRTFNEETGKYEYRAFNRLDPIGMLMGIAADYVEISQYLKPEERTEFASAFTLALVNNLTSKTWIKGLADVWEAIEYQDLDRVPGNFVASMIPAAYTQWVRANNPQMYEIMDVMDKAKSRLPGYSDTVRPLRNLWGEKVFYSNGWGPDFASPVANNFASPIYQTERDPAPVDVEIVDNRLEIGMPALRIGGVELNALPKGELAKDRYVYLAGNGATVHMNSWTYMYSDGVYSQPRPIVFKLENVPKEGLGAKDMLNQIVTNPLYQKITAGNPDKKKDIIMSVINKYRQTAAAMIQKEFPELNLLIMRNVQDKRKKKLLARPN